jgi:hypothetical protein
MSVDIKDLTIYLLSSTTVDLQTDANTTLYTVPTGKRCVLDHADIICGTAASTTAVITIGASTALTDFLGSQTLTNLAATNDVVHCYPIPNATPVKTKSYAAGTVIQLDVGTADVDGSDDATVNLFGYLYDA